MNLNRRIGMLVVIPQLVLVTLGNIPATETYVRVEAESVPAYRTVETLHAEISAYTSSPEETDDTPFITANGDTVGEGTIACPARYKFGTVVQIENRIYTCNDRMNKRYRDKNHFDIWFESRDAALAFGRQVLTVSILSKDIHSLTQK